MHDELRSFRIEGQLPVSGMLAARGASLPPELVPLHTEAVARAARYATRRTDGILHVRDNRVESFEVDGEEWAPTLFELSGKAYDLNVLEFAIGTNALTDVDWTVNSCLNEGIEGIHVAVGDGKVGAHIDFVAAGMQLVS